MLTELLHKVHKRRKIPGGWACRDWAAHTEADSILLEYFLPKLIQKFGPAFCRFADCGAHLGLTTLLYERILSQNLTDDALGYASIRSYEPMPDNLTVLRQATHSKPLITIRPVAVSEFAGQSQFVIPTRWSGGPVLTNNNTLSRSDNSSTEGHLVVDDDPLVASFESVITVDVVRLEDESVSGFDFVKMDLQGGERAALVGMGHHIHKTKLLYVEHQLLGHPDKQPLTLLQELGFHCFIDTLQFRFHEHITTIPADLLREGGIAIDCVEIMNDGKNSPRFQGHMEHGKTCLLQEDGTFPNDYAQALRDSGIHYLQTDILAINASIMPVALAMVER